MTSRRAFKHHEQKLARVLQFEPGHVGGRVASAQPVNRLGGTVRGSVVGAAGDPAAGGPGVLAGTVTAASTVTGTPQAVHPLAGALAAVATTTGTLTTAAGIAHPLAGTVAAITSTTGNPAAGHPLAGAVSAVVATVGTLTTATGVLQWSEYPAGYTWADHPASVTWADLDEPGAP